MIARCARPPIPARRRSRHAVLPAALLASLLSLGALLWASVQAAQPDGGAGNGAASSPSDPPAGERLELFVSILPQAGVVEEIGGDLVRVHVLVQPGQEPHTFEPAPRQVALLAQARLYFAIGLPFEKALLSRLMSAQENFGVVDMAAGVVRRQFSAADAAHAEEHEHGEPADRHESAESADRSAHAGPVDPHLWLSPQSLMLLARRVAEALSSTDPDHQAVYEKNLAAFLERAAAVDARIRRLLAPYRGRSFYIFHPSFGYFADAYGLKQVAVEVEGKSPSPRQLAELIAQARAEGVKVIFTQPQFDPRGAEAIAQAIGGVAVPLDPLAKDVLSNLERAAEHIAGAMER